MKLNIKLSVIFLVTLFSTQFLLAYNTNCKTDGFTKNLMQKDSLNLSNIFDAEADNVCNNTIHLSLSYIGVAMFANLNYERKLHSFEHRFLSSLWIKAQVGAWYVWADYGNQYTIAAMGLSGKNKNHLEYSLGITSLYNKAWYDSETKHYNDGIRYDKPMKKNFYHILPYASLGYRYQKPQGGLFFRTGVSFPETIYVGIGYAF